ncbi:RIF1 [Bugula neritina]|uniref:RIF1 n=1 Tax=Bugula neritina TaxID=10212 RepID=A0A7J7KLY0_BUGNE|nr:RIF1 [Bugula neritina]
MENQIKVYKVFQSLDLDSQEYVAKSAQLINKLNSDSAALSAIIADITSDRLGVRRGSCYLLGRLLEETGNNKLNISASHRSDIITGMVSSLSSSTDCQEASQLLWSLKRDILVSSDEMTPHVLPTLQACQHAVSDIKSSIANRPSYAVAAGALQLIAKFYKVQPDIMKANSRIWFSLVLPYCAHVSKQLRLCSQNIIEMSYDHLVAHAHIVREIVSDVAGVVIANITNIINKYYDEVSKIFAIKFWGLLILIMADKLENISTTNLFMSALTKAFSKNYSEIQAAAFEAWKLLINTFSVEYLLRPQLLKPLIIPLTKSNRSDDMLSLKARFNCWWLLIRRMDSSIQQHFTEVCKPLLEFCLADNSSSALPPPGLKSRNMTEKSLVKNSRSPLLINHLVAVTLQFLGQCDPPYMEEIQLGATQRDIELTKPILKHCAKVLFQSLDESIKYLKAHSTADSKGQHTHSPDALVNHSSILCIRC